jgi:uncharacterized protein (TIGR02118 family)
MLTRVGAAARLPALGVERFQQHWREQHGPTAGAIPNLRRYVQHHAVLVGGRLLLPYPGFDACSELDFDSPEAMDEGFARAIETGALRADEDRFVDKQRYSWVLGEVDERAPESAAADPVTLVTWWRAHPSASAERLLDVLTGGWEAALPPLAGRRLIAARADWHVGRAAPSADVVEVTRFDGLDAARSFLDGAAQVAGPLLAGVAFGAERHLARPVAIR